MTKTVEYFRCWIDGTWDTHFIEIPYDTPDDDLDMAVQRAVINIEWPKDIPCIVGFYSYIENHEDEDEYI